MQPLFCTVGKLEASVIEVIYSEISDLATKI